MNAESPPSRGAGPGLGRGRRRAGEIEAYLTEAGYEVVGVAADAAAALALGRRLGPDLALVDVRLCGPDDGLIPPDISPLPIVCSPTIPCPGSGVPPGSTAVPEPASLALLSAGLLGLGLVRRRP